MCSEVLESPLHRWWQCPRWGRARGVGGRNLEAEARRANFEPRCFWECGVSPAPEPGDVPAELPAAPADSEPGDGTIERGATVYTDASAMRPKDFPLRKAACVVWVGEGSKLNTAWPLPGLVQTAYRAELYAVVVFVERYRGTYTIVSDCRGVMQGAQKLLEGGFLHPRPGTLTSGHASTELTVGQAPGLCRCGVFFTRKTGFRGIAEADKRGNHEADALANAEARRIGPMLRQQERYDARLTFPRAVQGAQSTILDAAQRGGSATPGREHSKRRLALVGDFHTREWVRGGPIRDLQGGKMRTWEPHLVVASEGGRYRCIHCSRHATFPQARRAMAKLPCRERPGFKPYTMGGIAWERWNEAIVVRRDMEGGTAATIASCTPSPSRTGATSAWIAGGIALSGRSSWSSHAPGCRRDPSIREHSSIFRRGRSSVAALSAGMQSTKRGTPSQPRGAEQRVSTRKDSATLRASWAQRTRIFGVGFRRQAMAGGRARRLPSQSRARRAHHRHGSRRDRCGATSGTCWGCARLPRVKPSARVWAEKAAGQARRRTPMGGWALLSPRGNR